jgi:hypothetical protein
MTHATCFCSVLAAGCITLALTGGGARGQQYAVDGGFEAATADPATNANGSATLWTKDSVSPGAYWIYDTNIARSGVNCMRFQVFDSTAHRLQTKQTRFNTTANVVVQYYYKNGSLQGANVETYGGIKYNGQLVNAGTAAGTAAIWTKRADVLVVTGTSLSTDFAYIAVWRYGGTAMGDYYIDDVAIYDGTAVDTTPPDPPTSPSAVAASSTSLTVSWTAPATGTDNGGYLVVRGTADPATSPNVNGIYAVANTVAAGQTVVYIGTGTSFTDSGLTTCTTYYYRIYTFDKAFNYSAAAGGAAVSGKPSSSPPVAGSDSPICAGGTLHLTASTVSGATYAWTGPNEFSSSAQNPTLANATTAASGTYSVTATLNGCASAPGTAMVNVNALPTGGADTLSTPKNVAATISSAKLKANDTGTGMQITAATPGTGADHGSVSLSATDGSLTYTPRMDYTGSDGFTYTLSNDQGCTVQVPVTVTVGAGQNGSANVLYAGTVDGNFVVRFAGVPGETYTVQTNSVSSGLGWTKLGTDSFLAPAAADPHPYGIGVFQVTDPLGSSSRYYRTVWPAQ